jgi:hypothetical protein
MSKRPARIIKDRRPITFDVTSTQYVDGEAVQVSFTATCQYLTKSQLDEVLKRATDGAVTERELLDENVLSIGGIEGDDGSPGFHAAAKAYVLDDLAMSASLQKAWLQALNGAPEKNSAPSRRS